MKRMELILAAAMLALASCSPQAFTMDIEMRHPSKSGLDLAHKSMAVVYLDNGTPADSAFNSALASGFARRMEADYFGGEEVIRIYRMPKGQGDYSSRDTLANLIMDTGDDVVFLFDSTEFGEIGESDNRASGLEAGIDSSYVSTPSIPFKLQLYAYDSMNKEDKVLSFNGSNVIRPRVYNDGSLDREQLVSQVWNYVGPAAEAVGGQATGKFLSEWKEESFVVIYYEQEAWLDAARKAYNYQWDEAVDAWLKLYKESADVRGNAEKRSCAAYDIALGCFLLGQDALALKWLDRSDADQVLSVNEPLRNRIKNRMN